MTVLLIAVSTPVLLLTMPQFMCCVLQMSHTCSPQLLWNTFLYFPRSRSIPLTELLCSQTSSDGSNSKQWCSNHKEGQLCSDSTWQSYGQIAVASVGNRSVVVWCSSTFSLQTCKNRKTNKLFDYKTLLWNTQCFSILFFKEIKKMENLIFNEGYALNV